MVHAVWEELWNISKPHPCTFISLSSKVWVRTRMVNSLQKEQKTGRKLKCLAHISYRYSNVVQRDERPSSDLIIALVSFIIYFYTSFFPVAVIKHPKENSLRE